MIAEGSVVSGIDFKGNEIEGTVQNVLKVFGVAIVKYGDDRLQTTEAYVSDLRLK